MTSAGPKRREMPAGHVIWRVTADGEWSGSHHEHRAPAMEHARALRKTRNVKVTVTRVITASRRWKRGGWNFQVWLIHEGECGWIWCVSHGDLQKEGVADSIEEAVAAAEKAATSTTDVKMA